MEGGGVDSTPVGLPPCTYTAYAGIIGNYGAIIQNLSHFFIFGALLNILDL